MVDMTSCTPTTSTPNTRSAPSSIETVAVEPKALYFGTPVVLISTINEDGTPNLAPMSSAWWLGRSCLLGLSSTSKTTDNLQRHGETVLNLPDASLAGAVDRLARSTGTRAVPEHKRGRGYTHEADKFGQAGLTRRAADLVAPPRVAECPIQLEAVVERLHPVNDRRGPGLMAIEVTVVRTHVDRRLMLDEQHIDPEGWDPLLMKFCHYYGGASNLQPSSLAEAWGIPPVPS